MNTYLAVYVFVEMLPLITEFSSVIMYKLAIFTTYQLLCWTVLFYHLYSTNVIIRYTWHAALDVQDYALFGQLKQCNLQPTSQPTCCSRLKLKEITIFLFFIYLFIYPFKLLYHFK
jgi:hypothetical protein